MEKSDSIAALAAALAKAQAELKNPSFDKTNPHFKSKYATLAGVRDAVMPVLTKHGLSVTQLLGAHDSGVSCTTMLMHSSGEWIASRLDMPVSKQDAQGFGSASTYARRYSLMAITGVVGDDDDDGNAATAAKPAPAKATITPTSGVWESLTDDERSALSLLADSVRAELNEKSAAAAVALIEAEGLSADHKAALWTRFRSDERSAMKKAAEAIRKEPAHA